MKMLKRGLKAAGFAIVALLFLQSLYFLKVLFFIPDLEPADMIVSFEGRVGRAREAYRLADLGYAPVIVISPADERKLKVYDRYYRPQKQFSRIIENKARTTFENALYTSQIIRRNQYGSVILVTSWNHMARSHLLLKSMLLGTGTKVFTRSVKTGNITVKNWFRHAIGWKMVYNDMVDTWGSLMEMLSYKISGKLMDVQPGKVAFLRKLKDYMLFDIRPEELVIVAPKSSKS